jgi:hypothetical protein
MVIRLCLFGRTASKGGLAFFLYAPRSDESSDILFSSVVAKAKKALQ